MVSDQTKHCLGYSHAICTGDASFRARPEGTPGLPPNRRPPASRHAGGALQNGLFGLDKTGAGLGAMLRSCAGRSSALWRRCTTPLGELRRGFLLGTSQRLCRLHTQGKPCACSRGVECISVSPYRESVATDISTLRNIGVIAHVDAGKTTTVERLLYYSGVVRRMGDIDKGDTVMDFLEVEQERGITINSACISLPWNGHRLNIIDTPGHVDFMFEVERAVRVLDGALVIFDGTEGVQAQSETVWRQARKNGVPAVGFVNKFDKDGASLDLCVDSIEQRLGITALVTQLPLFRTADFVPSVSNDASSTIRGGNTTGGTTLEGVVDLISMESVLFKGPDGADVDRKPLPSGSRVFSEAATAREKLVDQLAAFSEQVMDTALAVEGSDYGVTSVTPQLLRSAVKETVLRQETLPLLVGSSFQKKGVQPLMDAVVSYLPSPLARQSFSVTRLDTGEVADGAITDPATRVLAFKVAHDPFKGMIVFFRVYSGVVSQTTLFNCNVGKKETGIRLFSISADDLEPVDSVGAGEIGAMTGLRYTRTGDTLLSDSKEQLVLGGITVPNPVFMCSIEPSSPKHQAGERGRTLGPTMRNSIATALEEALEHMQREDPSFVVAHDNSTGQTIVKGMGELHLEIIGNRLEKHFRVPSRTGRVYIAYACAVNNTFTEVVQQQLEVDGNIASATIHFSMGPVEEDMNDDAVQIDCSGPSDDVKNETLRQALEGGVRDVCNTGVLHGFPLVRTYIDVDDVEGLSTLTPRSARLLVSSALRRVLRTKADLQLLEPMMRVDLTVPDKHHGAVLADILSNRRGSVSSVDGEKTSGLNRMKHIRATIPLKSMIGYSSSLRSLTSGTASFSMDISSFGVVTRTEREKLERELLGL